MRVTRPLQCVLEAGQEGGVLQGSADRLDQVLVFLQTGAGVLRGQLVQTESSSGSNSPTEVKDNGVPQELSTKQILLEAGRGGTSQRLQSPAHRREETVEDFDHVRQEGDRIRLQRQELPERLEEGATGGRRPPRGGGERRINRAGEEPGQSQTTLRQTVVSNTRT